MRSSRYLDPRLESLLDTLRHRIRMYVVWDSTLAILAVILSTFWIGLALDYGPVQLGGTEMPRLARTILLSLVGIAVAVIVATMLIGRLVRPLPDDSLALLVERHHPELGGRLVTAVQLNQPDRHGDSHSPHLLQAVHEQAAAAVDRVDPSRIFRWQPLVRKIAVVAPLVLGSLIFLAISPQAFGRAVSRLTLMSDQPWPRRAHLEMVGVELPIVSASGDEAIAPQLVEFSDGTIRLPQGSSGTLRIRALAEGAEVPVLCTVYYETESGTRGQSNMRRVGRVVDGYQSFILDGPPLAGLNESMTIDVRGLDARLDDYRIEAVPPPVINDLEVAVHYPSYLRSFAGGTESSELDPGDSDADDNRNVPPDLVAQYQSGLRLREGSDVTLTATSTKPLGDADVVLKTDAGEMVDPPVRFSEDRRKVILSLNDFATATTINIVPRDQDGISAQAPYRYFLGVVLDEPPELEVRLKGIGSAITPIARIPIHAKASDDYGVAELTITATPNSSKTPSDQNDSEPVAATVKPPLNRAGEAETVMDLRTLVQSQSISPLSPGDALSLIGEASDYYDLGPPHITRSEVHRLEVVTPEQLIALMERRELGLRTRLEQTIDETRNLRDTLDMLRRTGFNPPQDDEPPAERLRQIQLRRLRVQQSGLQTNKTADELAGIAASLEDILLEMLNNRVDSVDRRERIAEGVIAPLRQIVETPLAELRDQINAIEQVIEDDQRGAEQAGVAVAAAEEVLLQLTAVLEKMLDLESFNEILDMVRELIDDQQKLLDDTKTERKKRVLDLFQ